MLLYNKKAFEWGDKRLRLEFRWWPTTLEASEVVWLEKVVVLEVVERTSKGKTKWVKKVLARNTKYNIRYLNQVYRVMGDKCDENWLGESL